MDDVVRYESSFDLPHPASDLWTILSKTDWLNQSLGLPPVTYTAKAAVHGGSEIRATASLYGLPLEWTEQPFDWIEPEFYQVRRVFQGGPWSEAIMGMRLVSVAPRQTRISVFSEFTPRNVLGALLAKTVVVPKTIQDMQKIMDHARQHLSNRVEPMLPNLQITPTRDEIFEAGLRVLKSSAAPADLVPRFESWLRRSPDAALGHIRPWVVAREWTADKWKVLSLFLHATRAGLLEFSWEVLCPNCRSARQARIKHLGDVPSASHCEVCQIRYDASFDQSVELKFAVSPSVRPVTDQSFCLAGPGGTPHIIGQATVAPGTDRDWRMPAGIEHLRLRSPNVPDSIELPRDLAVAGSGFTIRADPQGFAVAKSADAQGGIRLQNRMAHPVRFILERVAWSADILTAAQVAHWQDFKDLFSAEVISPHEQITVGCQVLLFTDLKGSTALYNEIGDAQAYAMVRDHFAALQSAVKAHRGSMVKTIGDAVMAVFGSMEDGMSAIVTMREKVAQLSQQPRHQKAMILKASLHAGPCLAVNANGRLDYFGTVVNLAARMVECSSGNDLIISDGVLHRPDVAAWIQKNGATTEPLVLQFRGFEQPHKIWRILLPAPPPPVVSLRTRD